MGEVFACACCGECCSGTGGIVLRRSDTERLAAHFHVPVPAFLERYAERARGKYRLRAGSGGACVFAEGATCGVHAARPDICRAWPFFRGNLVDSVSFFMATEGCAGMRRPVPFATFVQSGARYLLENGIFAGRDETDAPAALMREDSLRALLEER
ncbi:MAG: hypothetical protein DELT_00990 [Desulfovibrio sp.]